LLYPDRVLIGGEKSADGKIAIKTISDIYRVWIANNKIITTNLWSSELSKLASNALLAQRVSSINSLSALCEKTGAKVDEVALAVGMDSRIGPKFLKPSVGFGGSCFKKDILNLVYLCRFFKLYEVAEYWENVIKINDYQKNRFVTKIKKSLIEVKNNPTISILGWAFKKNTNDSRESPAIDIVSKLLELGIAVNVYDPEVSKETILNDLQSISNSKLKRLKIYSSLNESLSKSYGVCILTEWDEFRDADYTQISKNLLEPLVFIDGRNIVNPILVDRLFKHVMSLDT
jgi:UDPglucose 6-dehydrogenase